MTFEEQVAEALGRRVEPLNYGALYERRFVERIAPRVAAALRVTAHHRTLGGSLSECDALALHALSGASLEPQERTP